MRSFNAERSIGRYMDRWHYLLGMGRWKVTWEVTDLPLVMNGDACDAINDYGAKRGSGYRTSHVKFHAPSIASDAKAERAVIHELLHLIDHGIGNDAHKFIARLEPKLRMVRKRAK